MATVADSGTAVRRPSGAAPPPVWNRRRREALAGYAFVAPDLLGLMMFVGLPMVLAIGVSLFNADGFGGYTYVGLDNFRQMAGDTQLWQSVRVTVTYTAAFVPIGFVVSLGLALLVRDHFPGVGLVRTLFFVPHVISLVVVGIAWQFLLVDKQGAVPTLLRPVGLGDTSFLGDPSLALGSLVAISIWFLMGYNMLILLGGLKDIPKEYEEAAAIDGAGAWQNFRHVIWPLLRPTSFFVLVNSVVGSVTGLQAFDLVYVLTQGGPAGSTSSVVFYIYQQAFTFNDHGYAAALTTVVVGFLVAATATMFGLTKGGRFDAG
ncbi:sugar ABC transporter permease [Nonomuraea sp. KC401]|uniref:Sugar ABC transporter permease n=1 Tax=Nonomuraea longispora TaxID=1848320 RepID=A0A4R4ND85_9ACTN|nr:MULTISPECIES: sugar ABC transporter permease [Nonomuraea]NBE92187.1 ABC transporter permease subunit [Nonomuraea sp. K271]TDC06935.1 sugar ABC transporter permease [Nonomuraea longispora]TLF85677.1 sugar ABC transporter permease [Nonomuraea sp. KC401]